MWRRFCAIIAGVHRRSAQLLVILVLAAGGSLVCLGAVSWAQPRTTSGAQLGCPFSIPERVSPSPTPSPPDAILEPDLARLLSLSDPDGLIRVIVVLDDQARLERLAGVSDDLAPASDRVVVGLRSLAESSQAPLRAQLEGARESRLVESFMPFWIFNGVAVRGRASFIRSLASYPGVSEIRLDHRRQWLEPAPAAPARGGPVEASADAGVGGLVEWNIARIRAPEVWTSLRISGTGAVLAGMDTGVDWLHPALQETYRGYTAGSSPDHTGNWFDAVNSSVTPADDHGHGTHTMGTAVGSGGIGVAPGAQWIGLKVLDADGYGYDSWIHAGFEWLLAPAGDPALAPDVVNCSWGSSLGELTTFQPDLRALRAAGVLAVFAAGNSGPAEGTVGSPASLPEALAVGATDDYDEVTTFSSRGPSPWGDVRPHVAAPGAYVRSSLAGGGFVVGRGTSMAAPHVAGLAVLLRSVSPTLATDRAIHVVTSTALPLGDRVPNNDVGWGRVDALAAVAALAHPGVISGTVRRAQDGAPIAGASVVAAARSGGGRGTATTDDGGAYRISVAPGAYDLTVEAFGYVSRRSRRIKVAGGDTVDVRVSLRQRPAGSLDVRLHDLTTSDMVTGTIRVLGTPLEATANSHVFSLPRGSYSVQAEASGYRVISATAQVIPGLHTRLDVALHPAPSILLVDSGAWLYGSELPYFRQALDDLTFAYDEWPIRYLPDDVPHASNLTSYDVVIWSAPRDAPGYIGAEDAIAGYLSDGGRLLLTGQDVGYLDGGGWDSRPYYRDYLKARLVRDSSETWLLDGVRGDIYEGLALTITGAGGADNQAFPDEIAVADPDSAAAVLMYEDDGCGAIRVGTCLDYRIVYLSFGFEAIADRAARTEVMDRTLNWLASDPPAVGLEVTPASHTAIGLPGETVTHAVRVRHTGLGGITDTMTLSVAGAEWPTRVAPEVIPLAPCEFLNAVVTVTIPASASWDARDVVTLTAGSTLSSTLVQTAVLTSKAPAPVLLVDDDRFFEQSDKYEAALSDAGLAFDSWRTCPATGWCRDDSPPLRQLLRYPIVVWWTGYDWYQPVTTEELATLDEYLDAGGRLFLSSQDYLYHHGEDSFTHRYLGVLTYTEHVTVTSVGGVPEHPVSDGLGPYELAYPFPEETDSVHPAQGSAVLFRDQAGRGVGLNTRTSDGATVFLAFPFESLPEAARAKVAQQAIGWLSWLGGSRFSSSTGSVVTGGRISYTLWLRNDGPVAITASLSNTLPGELSIVPGTLTNAAAYDTGFRRVSWQGRIEAGSSEVLGYQADLDPGAGSGSRVENTAELVLVDQQVRFARTATVRVDVPDLSTSALCPPESTWRSGAVISSCLVVVNTGVRDALAATATLSLPAATSLVTGSLQSTGVGSFQPAASGLRWTGPLSVGQAVTVGYQLRVPAVASVASLDFVTFLADDLGGAWECTTWVAVQPWQVLMPIVRRMR